MTPLDHLVRAWSRWKMAMRAERAADGSRLRAYWRAAKEREAAVIERLSEVVMWGNLP